MHFNSGRGPWALLIVALGVMMAGRVGHASEATAMTRDTLVFKDGDRVHGRLVEQAGGVLVFQSERFGELRVPAVDAVVIKAEQSESPVAAIPPAQPPPPKVTATAETAPAATAKAAAVVAAERADEERVTIWDRFSPSVLTSRVRNFFGPWHGRFSFSSEVVTDFAKRDNRAYEMFVKRKWTTDEVQLNARYDYNKTNALVSTDLMKLWGQWRREFSKNLFMQYRPTGEWNRASQLRGLPNDYTLLQQDLGVGYQVLTKASRRARLGVSQNRFDTWNSAVQPHHTSRDVRSVFEEAEVTLPWRMAITQRGVWYPVSGQVDGWENRIELNKKLTETLSTSLRHEIRRDNPDGSAQDYTRLKLFFGLDF